MMEISRTGVLQAASFEIAALTSNHSAYVAEQKIMIPLGLLRECPRQAGVYRKIAKDEIGALHNGEVLLGNSCLMVVDSSKTLDESPNYPKVLCIAFFNESGQVNAIYTPATAHEYRKSLAEITLASGLLELLQEIDFPDTFPKTTQNIPSLLSAVGQLFNDLQSSGIQDASFMIKALMPRENPSHA